MGPARNLDILHQYLREVWDEGDIDAVERYLAPTYVRHGSPTEPPIDRKEQMSKLRSFRDAFPDIELVLEEASADRDLVWFRSTMHGTHEGDFLGMPATGRRVEVSLLDLWRVSEGRVVEQWGGPDVLDLARQLGARLSTHS